MTGSFRDIKRIIGGLKRLWPLFHIPRRHFATILITSFLAAGLEGIGVGLLLPMLELLRNEPPKSPMKAVVLLTEWMPGHSMAFYTVTLCAIVVVAVLLKNLALYAGNLVTATMRSSVVVNLRDAIYRKLQYSDLSVYEQSTSGEISSAILLESGRTAYAVEFLSLLLQRSAIGACYLVALLLISWQLSLMTAVLAGISASLLSVVYRRLAENGRELGSSSEQVSSHLLETLGGVRLIRVTDSQEREIKRAYDLNCQYGTVHEESARSSALVLPITETTGVLGGMAIVGGAAVFLVQPGYMRGEMLMGFAFVLLRMLPILSQVYGLYGHTVNLASGVEQAEKWLAIPQFPKRPFGSKQITGIHSDIRIRDLTFRYANGTEALSQINLEIPAGKIVALVGGSGSGKSTLAALLLRLREPSNGKILVDGEDYWNFTSENWHRNVAMVEQEAFLFSGTLADNVRYGYDQATDDDVLRALEKAHLSHVIAELPLGIHTLVGERGSTLSGGQRQRMAIARALVRDPKLLVLDEATSALDSVSEAQVQAAIDEAQQGRTVLIIAHRFSTIRRADRIVVLEGGKIVEQGSWGELEARSGAFHRLLRASQEALV